MKTVLALIIFVLLISFSITLLLIYPRRRKYRRRYYELRPDTAEYTTTTSRTGADLFEIDFVKKV
ncbi:MAG: hypothetical protein LBF04_02075 [Prevotellaceae bacterium]|jgi:hypothetical protein|nr:hypothetical protein [Prevotellaceae bacterium]